jgi:two-component system phosphate regulon sensor histidine kinase PhoR
MTWLFPRLTATVIAVVAGALFGGLFAALDGPWLGGLAGAGCALGVIVVRDTLHGFRLIAWLRGSQEGDAPRSAGLWGELGYRIERAIRLRELQAATERDRLTQFLSAIDASPNGVMMLDAGDQIEWCNAPAADHFGLDPQRDLRQRVTNLVRAPAFVDYLQAGKFDDAVQVPDPHGRGTLSVLVRHYGDGQKLVLSQDITERERSEAMRRDFVANVSHEIRTPLTVLAGFIETMTNLPLTESESKRVLVLMAQQADRMATLVSDLLTLAQLEGSPRPHADRWVPLASMLAQVAVDAKGLSAGRHTVTFPADGGVQIAAAPNELQSAVTNLVNNAVRYTPEGGQIDVTWRILPDGAGELAVSDTGPGIEREHLPRLTERFYRVDNSRSRDTGGTGLGLSIVKHVVQRHGGALDIQSEPGRGSTFRLIFPALRVRGAPATPDSATAPAEVDTAPARALP